MSEAAIKALRAEILELRDRLDNVSNLAAKYAKDKQVAIKELLKVKNHLNIVQDDLNIYKTLVAKLTEQQIIHLNNNEVININEIPMILSGLGAALDEAVKKYYAINEKYRRLPESIQTKLFQHFGTTLNQPTRDVIKMIIDEAVRTNGIKTE